MTRGSSTTPSPLERADETEWLRRIFILVTSGVHVVLVPLAVAFAHWSLGPAIVTRSTIGIATAYWIAHLLCLVAIRWGLPSLAIAVAVLVLAEALPLSVAFSNPNPSATIGMPVMLVAPLAAASPLLHLWASPVLGVVNIAISFFVFQWRIAPHADAATVDIARMVTVRGGIAMMLTAAVGYFLARTLVRTHTHLRAKNDELAFWIARQSALSALGQLALAGGKDVVDHALAAVRELVICDLVAWTRSTGADEQVRVLASLGCDKTCPKGQQCPTLDLVVRTHAATGLPSGFVVPAEPGRVGAPRQWIVCRQGEAALVAARSASRAFSSDEVLFIESVASLLATVMGRDEAKSEQAAMERRLGEFARMSPDGIISLDATGCIVSVNEGALLLTGRTATELVGQHVFRVGVTDPADRELAANAFAALLTGPEATAAFTLRVQRADGSLRKVEISASRIVGPSGATEILGIVRDATDRERFEEHVRAAQRLDGLGQLAGGVAHDFNNLLTGVLASASLLLDDAHLSAETRELASEIKGAGERGAALTRKLLAFSRQQALAPKVIDVDEQLDGLAAVLRRVLGERVSLEIVRGAQGAWVRVDPTQLEQAVMNLCINARDAMPKGGVIVVETSTTTVTAARAELPGVGPGRWVLITVRDTGDGIPPSVLDRIFEPFFTTKPVGQGTGLGLAMVHGFVTQSGGVVLCESRVGVGSVFRLVLPEETRDTTSAPASVPQQRSLPTAPRQRGLVVIVDDDALVRRSAARILEAAGYRVEAAADAPAAMRLLDEHCGHVRAVVTDIVMPNMSGIDFARSVANNYPQLPVIFMSGYTRMAPNEAAALMGRRLIEKPFAPATLLAAIDGVVTDG